VWLPGRATLYCIHCWIINCKKRIHVTLTKTQKVNEILHNSQLQNRSQFLEDSQYFFVDYIFVSWHAEKIFGPYKIC